MGSSYYTTTTSVSDLGDMSAIFGALSAMMIPMIIVAVLMIVAEWKIFTKAGEAGWKSIIPIYNLIVLYKIIGINPLFILVYLASVIPVIGGFVVLGMTIYQQIKLGQAFGKETGFIIGLVLLEPIFLLMLAFGSSEYIGPQTKEA